MKKICCVSRFWAALCWITLIEQLCFTCLLIVVEDGRSDLWWALTSHAAGLQSHYYVGIYSVVEVCLPWPCWWIFQGKVYSHFVSLNCVCIYVYKLYCEQQNGARCAQTYLLYLFLHILNSLLHKIQYSWWCHKNCILVFQLGLDAHDGVYHIWTSERSLSVTRTAGD